MVFHRGREHVELLRRTERRRDLGRRITLHPELRAKAELLFLVRLDRLARVPHVPEVAVPGVLVVVALAPALGVVRRTGPVGRRAVEFLHDPGQQVVKDGLVGFRAGLGGGDVGV